MQSFSEHNILVFLIQVFLLLGLSRGLGEIFRKFKQPTLTAEILVGILLGPTIFGRFLPQQHRILFPQDIVQQSMLETMAWLGILFFLLETGLKMDFSSAWRHRGKALLIALTDIIVPMIIGFIFSFCLPESYLADPSRRISFAFFMATVITISAMPITTRALNDLNLIKTDLGFLIMSALSVNEIIGWMIFALVLGFFLQANIVIGQLIIVFLLIILFTVFCLTTGRRMTNFVIAKFREKNLPEPGSSLTFTCLLGLLCGAIFQKIGVNALIGFFIAGVMAGEAKALSERTRQVISQMVYAIFVPLFFAGLGLRIDFLKNFDLLLVLLVTFFGIFGKFLGAWLGVTFTSLPRVNRLSVAVAHTPGGSMEIVIGILALQHHLITESIFVAIVFGGVISSILLGPWLKYSISRRKQISILEFSSQQEIVAEVRAADRDNAIRELCTLAYEQGNMPDIEALYSYVLQRENTLGTAVEEGVAFPHARISLLVKPTIIFGRSISGIEWNSPDGKPTHFIFLILTPREDDDIQIQILRIIAKTMSDSKIKDAIMAAKSRQELWGILQAAFTPHQIVRTG
jgi:Kef-type K+ transport system membrane component KefB/mannitol/fructose-specific phosphotransferase system IIA component (Ntr-type)